MVTVTGRTGRGPSGSWGCPPVVAHALVDPTRSADHELLDATTMQGPPEKPPRRGLPHHPSHQPNHRVGDSQHLEERGHSLRSGGGGAGTGRTTNCRSVNLNVGNYLQTVHPSPILSNQVILVPSMFGSELNQTTFWDVREELEPMLRETWYSKYKTQDWSIDKVPNNTFLVTKVERKGEGMKNSSRWVGTAQYTTNTDETKEDDDKSTANGNDDGEEDDYLGGVTQRICQYFSIDPDNIHVNAGILVGQPSHRSAYSKVRWTGNCFVAAVLGASRALVLRCGPHDPSFRVTIPNNAVVAVFTDVCKDGWQYGVENLTAHELQEEATPGCDGSNTTTGNRHRTETITLFLSGTCTTMRRVPSPVLPQWSLPPIPPPAGYKPQGRRASSASDGGGRDKSRRDSIGSDDASWQWRDSREGDARNPVRATAASDSSDRRGSLDHPSQHRRASALLTRRWGVGADDAIDPVHDRYGRRGRDDSYDNYWHQYGGEPPYPPHHHPHSDATWEDDASYDARGLHHRFSQPPRGNGGDGRNDRGSSIGHPPHGPYPRSRSRSRSASPPHRYHQQQRIRSDSRH